MTVKQEALGQPICSDDPPPSLGRGVKRQNEGRPGGSSPSAEQEAQAGQARLGSAALRGAARR